MHETFAVKVAEDVQDRLKQCVGFVRRECPAGKNLSEVFLRIRHHHVHEESAAKLEMSHFMDRNQVRVREPGGLLPTRQLQFGLFWSRGNKFDRGLFWNFTLMVLREEYRAVVGPA